MTRAMRLSMRNGTWPGCRPDSHVRCDRATSIAMSAPELPAPTSSTSPGCSWLGFLYSLECSCTMPRIERLRELRHARRLVRGHRDDDVIGLEAPVAGLHDVPRRRRATRDRP